MRLTYKEYLSIALILAIVAVIGVVSQRSQKIYGNTDSQGGGNYSTSTKDQLGNNIALRQVLKNGPGILGSVLITGTSTGSFILYDSTTTDATKRTNPATTTIFSIGSTTPPMPWPLNSNFNYGLLLDYVGSLSTTTITWK